MEPKLRARKLWLAVGWALVLFVIVISLVPNPPVGIPIEGGDKVGHVIAYGTLMCWFTNLYDTRGSRALFAIGFVLMGIALEFVQRETGYRTFEIADMVADAAGVIGGWVLAPPRLPNGLQYLEMVFRR